MEFFINSKKHGTFVVLVDDIDEDLVKRYKYSLSPCPAKGFYAIRSVHLGRCDGKAKKQFFSLHKEIALRMGLSGRIDHENRNSLDNRRGNLRLATHQQNCQNRELRNTNTTGTTGVWFSKRLKTNPWLAQIMVDGKTHHLGCFSAKQLAIDARVQAARKYFTGFSPH